MIKTLILIRHSFAEGGGYSDIRRKLTPLGNTIGKRQAKILLNENLLPEVIISSNAVRAKETSEIIYRVLKPKNGIELNAMLYKDYTTQDFFDLINSLSCNINVVAIVAHNPNLSAMASRLDSQCYINFKPCSIAVFNCGESWQDAEVGKGKFIQYFES